jgi:hypothetical protein
MAFIVSGCARNGTSLMMDIMRVLMGDASIVGDKFFRNHDDADLPEYAQYVRDKVVANSDRSVRTRDMNPNGFWECIFTTNGIRYFPEAADLLNDLEGRVVKVVAPALAMTEPKYVERVIYMVRQPDSTAKSQERIIRRGFNDEGDPTRDDKPQRIFSYLLYNRSAVLASKWIVDNNPPLLVVDYDELIDNPREQIRRVAEFVGAADQLLDAAVERVDPSLRRSVDIPEDVDIVGQEFAYEAYENIKSGAFEAVKASALRLAEIQREKQTEVGRKYCMRLRRAVVNAECEMCQTHEQTRINYRENATRAGVRWESEPCAYDCLISGKTIEESVTNNHWL